MKFRKFTSFLLASSMLSQSVAPSLSMDTPGTARDAEPHPARIQNAGNASTRMDELYMHRLYDGLLPEAKHLSPLNGMLILNSNILAKVRFEGLYGSYNPRFLCHYQIATPDDRVSTANIDSPQDFTTSIVQQLFPSPAGGILVLPAVGLDFFRSIPHTQIAQLLVLYSDLKSNNVDYDVAYKMLHDLFKAWLCVGDSQAKISWKCPSKHLQFLKEVWGKSNISLELLAQKYAEMFAGSLSETFSYPEHFVESALLALAWKRANNNINDINTMHAVYKKNNRQIKNFSAKERKYNSVEYYAWKEKNIINGVLTNEVLEKLLDSPTNFIFVTLGYDRYDNALPTLLGTGKAIFTHPDGDNTTFSDCGESATLDFFNSILGDSHTKTFILERLNESYPKASPKLINFFEKDQKSFTEIVDSTKHRSLWADVVSNLNTIDSPLKVEYADGDGRCNIRGIGVDNIFIVLEKILNAPIYSLYSDEMDENKRRAKIMTHLLKSLSPKDRKFTWEENKQSESLENFGPIVLCAEGEKLFKWSFLKGHFMFEYNEINNRKDWRQNNDSILESIFNRKIDSTIKSQLSPFYAKDQMDKDTLNLLVQSSNGKYIPELMYGSLNNGIENKLNAIDCFLQITPKFVCDLAPRWLEKLPNDRAINQMIISLIFKHHQFFTPDNFNMKICPRIYNLYHMAINELKTNFSVNNWLSYLERNPYSENLLMYFISGLSEDKINSKNILHLAIKNKFLDLTKLLVKRGSDVNKLDKFNKTPFICALEAEAENRYDFLLFLLERGACIKNMDGTGRLALQILFDRTIISKDISKVFKLLLELGEHLSSFYPYCRDEYRDEVIDTAAFVGRAIAETATDEEFIYIWPKLLLPHQQSLNLFDRFFELCRTNPELRGKIWPASIEKAAMLGQEDALDIIRESGYDSSDLAYDSLHYSAVNDIAYQADLGNPIALYIMGCLYFNGRFVSWNEERAIFCYGKAASQGNKKAFQSICDLAEDGNPIAQNELGNFYNTGEIVDKDDQETLYWFEKAAQQGNASAQFRLAVHCYMKPTYYDIDQAVDWLYKAYCNQHPNALSIILILAKRGHERAFQILRDLAKKGDLNVQGFIDQLVNN